MRTFIGWILTSASSAPPPLILTFIVTGSMVALIGPAPFADCCLRLTRTARAPDPAAPPNELMSDAPAANALGIRAVMREERPCVPAAAARERRGLLVGKSTCKPSSKISS